jgi:hypothetical protein
MADVADKLQLRPDQRLHVLEEPAEASALLTGVTRAADRDGADADAVLLFARDQADVEAHAARLRDHLRAGGIAWAAFPSAASDVVTDLEGDRGWDALAELGLRPVRHVALDAVWSALRFRFADDERGG